MPKQGPSEGHGEIHIYGDNFRDDFALADIGCMIGESKGKGKVLSSDEIVCIVEEMDLVDEGQSLPAFVALNSYSWTNQNENATFVPYGMNGIFPSSGPFQSNTDVLITGKGFELGDDRTAAYCRFGVAANYAIVEAVILGYDKMVCRSPAEFPMPANSENSASLSVPVGVAFIDE
jgi:hypothetical protein